MERKTIYMATTKTTRTKTTSSAKAANVRKTAGGNSKTIGRFRKRAVPSRTANADKAATASKTVPAKIPKLPKSVAGAVRAAYGKKALDVMVLDLRKAAGFTDYFVICTGTNPRQINSIADAVTDTLRNDFGERLVLAEGAHKSEWILLDYFNFVVHVFGSDCRAFYGLERLWGNAERYECADTA